MSNLCLAWRNHALTGPIVTSSTASSALQGDQLQNDQGASSAAWQTASGQTNGAILLNRPAGTKWRAFGLFRTNLTDAATVDWYVGNGTDFTYIGSPRPSVARGYGQSVHVAPVELEGDAMQVNISDPGNPDGFLNIPLMYAGPAWQPKVNYSYQSAPNRIRRSTRSESRAGGVTNRTDWIKRTFDLSLNAVDASEVRSQLAELELAAHRGGNVLFVPNPDSPDVQAEALFGEVEPQSGITYPFTTGKLRGWRASIVERL